LHDTGDDISSLIKIYPGTFSHDFPEYLRQKPTCTIASLLITCNGIG